MAAFNQPPLAQPGWITSVSGMHWLLQFWQSTQLGTYFYYNAPYGLLEYHRPTDGVSVFAVSLSGAPVFASGAVATTAGAATGKFLEVYADLGHGATLCKIALLNP